MNIVKISAANLKFRWLNNLFNIVILALGIAAIIALLKVGNQVEKRFYKDLRGIDLVIGAKGSPVQMILSSVYHMDIPNGNIPLKEAKALGDHALVKTAIPINLGDNYDGFRIVGTNVGYINHYHGTLAQGKMFTDEMEVVLGSQVAQRQHLALGDKIFGSHGLVNGGDVHADDAYVIVGILKPTDTVLDRLLLTPLESTWHVHEHPEEDEDDHHEHEDEHHEHEDDHHEHEDEHDDRQITSMLISYKTPLAALKMPRMVNESSSMQAANPALEVARLVKMLGTGTQVVKIFAIILIIIAAIGFCVTLFNMVLDRRYEIALMRGLGATRKKILSFVLAEGLTLTFIAILLGVILGHIAIYYAQIWLEHSKHIKISAAGFSIEEVYIIISALLIGLVATIIPALIAYRVNLTKLLSRGL